MNNVDMTVSLKAKPIHFPFFDNFFLQILETVFIIGLTSLGLYFLTKYIISHYESVTVDEEYVNIMKWTGIILPLTSIALFTLFKLTY